MEPASPSGEMTVETVLNEWPASIDAFLALRLACVGCPMARFCTLDDAARAYRMAAGTLIGAVRARAARGGPAQKDSASSV